MSTTTIHTNRSVLNSHIDIINGIAPNDETFLKKLPTLGKNLQMKIKHKFFLIYIIVIFPENLEYIYTYISHDDILCV